MQISTRTLLGYGSVAGLFVVGIAVLFALSPQVALAVGSLVMLAFVTIAVLLQRQRARIARAEVAGVHVTALLDAAPDALLSISLEGVLTSWNASAARLFGYAAPEIIGRSFTCLLPPDRVQEAPHVLAHVRQGVPTTQHETVWLCQDGSPVKVLLIVSPIRTANSTIVGAVIVARDLRPQETVKHEQEEVFSLIRHELRTPLTCIRGALELLDSEVLDSSLSEISRRMLDIARTNTERLGSLITELLKRNRIDARTILSQHQLAYTAALDTVISDPIPPVPQGEGALVLVCDDDLSSREVLKAVLEKQGYRAALVASGQDALEQAAALQPAAILLDLLMPGMNGWETATALKAQPETRAIPIIIASVLSPGDDLWLPPEACGVVNKLLLNEATLFQTLRQACARPDSSFQVLVVEDDPDCATLLRAMFEGQGIATVHARTVQAAIALSQRVFPDLLVLDLLLPDGDGFAIVNALRQQLSLRGTPVIVYSAKDLEENEQARLTLGPTRFITKSQTTLREFEQQMRDVLPQVIPQEPGITAYGHDAHISH